jgi:hypothetical protein
LASILCVCVVCTVHMCSFGLASCPVAVYSMFLCFCYCFVSHYSATVGFVFCDELSLMMMMMMLHQLHGRQDNHATSHVRCERARQCKTTARPNKAKPCSSQMCLQQSLPRLLQPNQTTSRWLWRKSNRKARAQGVAILVYGESARYRERDTTYSGP